MPWCTYITPMYYRRYHAKSDAPFRPIHLACEFYEAGYCVRVKWVLREISAIEGTADSYIHMETLEGVDANRPEDMFPMGTQFIVKVLPRPRNTQ